MTPSVEADKSTGGAGAAPANEPGQSRRRDPRVAAALSMVPGLGQLYNFQPGKALFFFPSALLLTVGLALGFGRVARDLGPRLLGAGYGVLFPFVVLFGVILFLALFLTGLAVWASAVIDARRSAQELSAGRRVARRWWLLRL